MAELCPADRRYSIFVFLFLFLFWVSSFGVFVSKEKAIFTYGVSVSKALYGPLHLLVFGENKTYKNLGRRSRLFVILTLRSFIWEFFVVGTASFICMDLELLGVLTGGKGLLAHRLDECMDSMSRLVFISRDLVISGLLYFSPYDHNGFEQRLRNWHLQVADCELCSNP